MNECALVNVAARVARLRPAPVHDRVFATKSSDASGQAYWPEGWCDRVSHTRLRCLHQGVSCCGGSNASFGGPCPLKRPCIPALPLGAGRMLGAGQVLRKGCARNVFLTVLWQPSRSPCGVVLNREQAAAADERMRSTVGTQRPRRTPIRGTSDTLLAGVQYPVRNSASCVFAARMCTMVRPHNGARALSYAVPHVRRCYSRRVRPRPARARASRGKIRLNSAGRIPRRSRPDLACR